jgi:AsmA protein
LTAVGADLDLRAQGSFDRLDIAALFGNLGQSSRITGAAQGGFVLEGIGGSAAEIARRSHGRATLAVRSGEMVGLGLHEWVRRSARQPPDGRGARTPFDQAQVSLNINSGIAEIADGSLTTSNLRAALQGRASLADQTIAITVLLDGAGDPPPAAIEISGPWDDVKVAPVGRMLIQRSGGMHPSQPIEPARAWFWGGASAQ